MGAGRGWSRGVGGRRGQLVGLSCSCYLLVMSMGMERVKWRELAVSPRCARTHFKFISGHAR